MQSILAATMFVLAAAMDASAGLTLQEAQRQAVARSRQLQGQDARVESALAMAQAATRLPDPVLKVGIDNVPADGSDRFSLTRDFMTMRRVGVTQEWTRGEKRALRRERYEREADQARAERLAALSTIQRDAALAWLDRHFTEAMAAAAQRFVAAAGAEVEAADAAYRAGRGSQAAVFASRSTLALAEDRRIEIDRRVRAARIALARWTGGSGGEALAPPPPMSTMHLENRELESHLTIHPDVVALERQAQVAEAEARIAETAKRPDWTFEAAYQQRGSAYPNMFSVGVSIPLPWDSANRQDREAAARRALAEDARARRDEMLRDHVAEVAGMLDEWHAGRERQSRYARDVLPLAHERTEATLASYAGNRAGLDEVLAARRAEFDASLQSLQLDLDVARLWARLEFLLPDAAAADGVSR